MDSASFFIDPAAERTECEGDDYRCGRRGAETLRVPEHHRKPGGRMHLFLCQECREAQLIEWDTEDDAARAEERELAAA